MKKPILGHEGQYNLAPIEHTWAWNMLDKSIKNHWHPNEIGIGDDLLVWKTLTEAEKHLFTSVFATLTTSDMCVQRNLAVCVYEAIAAPEIAAFIGNQIKEEVIHSITYQYVIEHLGLDEDRIYNLYKNVPEIAQKFALADRYSKYLINYRNTKSVDDLLIGLIFYYLCFEGGWFYNGFSPIFALKRRNLMRGASEQLQYIMRDEAAHMAFGTVLIKKILAEYENSITQEIVETIFNEVVKSEKVYASYAIPTITGYNAELHVDHLKFLLDRRSLGIGFKKIYNTPAQFNWLDEMIAIKKESNFFETKVTEYQTSVGMSFEPTKLEDILAWK